MYCAKCQSELLDCVCPNLRELLAGMSDVGAPLASRWCKRCDSHYAVCSCSEPEWMLRVDGKLQALPDA